MCIVCARTCLEKGSRLENDAGNRQRAVVDSLAVMLNGRNVDKGESEDFKVLCDIVSAPQVERRSIESIVCVVA